MKNERDYSKYRFNGKLYSKGQFALAVISHYMQNNPKTTAKELRALFPRKLQTRFPVVAPENEAKEINDKGPKRYFDGGDQIIVAFRGFRLMVTNYWGSKNIQPFVKYVRKEFGYKITKVSVS